MVSLGLGDDAIVRVWHRHLGTDRWRDTWRMLLGDSPAPHSLQEAYRRRHELVRPAAVSIERDGPFWRVVSVDYDDDSDDDADTARSRLDAGSLLDIITGGRA